MEKLLPVIILIVGVLIVLFLAMLFLIAPAKGNDRVRNIFYHRNLAHRGLHTPDYKVPENSMAAFAAAVAAGYGIELDLQFSKDEKIVVFHDDDLKRVCGIEGRVDAYTYEELREFSLRGTQERIPLFEDVLKLVDGKVPMLVEFKNGPKNNLLCEKTLPMLRGYKGDFCIESFSPFIVAWFKKNAPDILRGQLSAPAYEFKGVLKPFQGFMLSNLLTNVIARPQFIAYHKDKRSFCVKLADRMGAMRFVWTVRPQDNVSKLEDRNDSVIFEFYRPDIKY